jgi:D-amino peptidase
MRICLCTDLEGISGVCIFEQTRDRTTALFQEARHLLMGDLNACVEGCLEGGADEVVVRDGHGGGFNILPEELHPEALCLTGVNRPRDAGWELQYDAAILLGYHAMNGAETGVLHHTQSSQSESKYWYNDRECGEIAQSALIMGHYGVPVVMVTGDEACCAEAREFLGDEIVTVAVKKGYAREAALIIAPKRARGLIREGAREAMSRVGRCKPFRTELPIRGKHMRKDLEQPLEKVFESALGIYDFS